MHFPFQLLSYLPLFRFYTGTAFLRVSLQGLPKTQAFLKEYLLCSDYYNQVGSVSDRGIGIVFSRNHKDC